MAALGAAARGNEDLLLHGQYSEIGPFHASRRSEGLGVIICLEA